jgi:hypothetical protein
MPQSAPQFPASPRFINSDVAEIGAAPAKPASFASVWFGPDFQVFRPGPSRRRHPGLLPRLFIGTGES